MTLNAYIVDVIRTPVGKRNGSLKTVHPTDLGAFVLDTLIERTGVPGDAVDDVIFGCVSKIGAQSANVARNCILGCKNIPESVPGVTVDRQCGSGQEAIHMAANAVMSGNQDVVIAGGVENMSQVPIGTDMMLKGPSPQGIPYGGVGLQANYGEGTLFHQFKGAELLSAKFGLTRADLDKYSLLCHHRALAAQQAGRFEREIVAVPAERIPGATQAFQADEGVRPNASLEAMAKMKPIQPDGIVTAASASQISDGAAAVLIVNERALQKYGLTPRARIVSMAVVGSCPHVMLEGPVPATQAALRRAGLQIEDIDLYECNEAFAPVALHWARAVGADESKMNVNGGAVALGHPLGATGCKLMATLTCELERRGGRYGLLAICEGGGTANVTIIERLDHLVPKARL